MEELSVSVDELPPDVDVTKKEHSLREADFEKVFNLSQQEFFKLPKWKQNEAKKKTPLY